MLAACITKECNVNEQNTTKYFDYLSQEFGN